MRLNDVVNAIFEFSGGIVCWMNCLKILKDRKVRGVYWPVWIFYTVWGFWNLYYYPSVDCWWSFWAGAFLVIGNTVWVVNAFRFRKN